MFAYIDFALISAKFILSEIEKKIQNEKENHNYINMISRIFSTHPLIKDICGFYFNNDENDIVKEFNNNYQKSQIISLLENNIFNSKQISKFSGKGKTNFQYEGFYFP